MESRNCRLLVAIASYGTKNLDLLRRLIRSYQAMEMEVDVVVLSDAPKEVPAGVRVLVGLPSKNPWSLPFAHKAVFVENANKYDLFAYSEDDIEVTEQNIQAFLRVTPSLEADEIAGFLRYEIGDSGEWSLPEAHGSYHWKPESVARRGIYTVSEFSNEHAGFYLLTRSQLTAAVASGGFVREPYEGRYDMLCTAATDPYTSCGFRKVICVSVLDDFLVHHLSDRYAGQLGVSLPCFRQQIDAVLGIANGTHPKSSLFADDFQESGGRWSKSFYERPCDELIDMIPMEAKSILSIGCGWGATEATLVERGANVTAVPLDSVIGVAAAHRGIDVIYGNLLECLEKLRGRTFDCVFVTNLLHLVPEPRLVIEQCACLLRRHGVFVVGGPNLNSIRMLAKRILYGVERGSIRATNGGGLRAIGPGRLRGYFSHAGFSGLTVRWHSVRPLRRIERGLGRLGSTDWIVQAQR